MTEAADKPATLEAREPVEILNAAAAPIIYFDGLSATGHLESIIQLELATLARLPTKDGKTTLMPVTVARLRTTIEGLRALKSSIQEIELMMAPPDGKAN